MPSEILTNLRGRAPINQRDQERPGECAIPFCRTPTSLLCWSGLTRTTRPERVRARVLVVASSIAPRIHVSRAGAAGVAGADASPAEFLLCPVSAVADPALGALYLGRRVYLGGVTVLGSALRGTLSGAGLRALVAELGAAGDTGSLVGVVVREFLADAVLASASW